MAIAVAHSLAWQGAGSLSGYFERLVTPIVLRWLYADELSPLDR